ncbi:MAG: vitamin B12 dependent methionine synthase [Candidatus Hydrogenedentes bacterium]|nr:vitamin B12 dependent methionine synthase [Candidatus Hydrogenedentota bacterium]
MDAPDCFIVLDEMEVSLKEEVLLPRLHADKDSVFLDDIRVLAAAASACARPKGLFKLAALHAVDERTIMIDDVLFESRILVKNLSERGRAFPFLATCGTELEDWSCGLTDPMHQYWADVIKELFLEAALQQLQTRCQALFGSGPLASMNPGSLEDWPITEQRPLFSLFGEKAGALEISLSEEMLMFPIKSLSGLWFETTEDFKNCQLCPRERCEKRRAPYDAVKRDRLLH